MALSYAQLKELVPVVLKAGNVPNIVGEAGVGKSALVADIAQQMQAKLVTTVVSLSEKGDLALPIPPLNQQDMVDTKHYGRLADVKFGYNHTLIDIITAAEKEPERPIIWFLDEFNRGNQAVQAELMNLVLQRQINDIVLPDNVYLVLAENPDDTMSGFEEDQYAVQAADSAIKDRTTRLVMKVAVTDWLAWAATGEPVHIDPLIRRFIAGNANMLYPEQRSGDLDPTPRAWQRVSDNYRQLKHLPAKEQDALLYDLVAGDLGQAAASLLVAFLNENTVVMTAEDIFDSQPAGNKVPKKVAQQFRSLSEIQKMTVMKSLIKTADITKDSNAARYSQLLQMLAPDSQYAVVQQLVNDPVLDDLYQSDQHHANVLYQQIMDIATH
ncbi:AAA family ATPase [Eupransor demetentiae]|uniref:MoxR-like ATPase (MoxR) n=1 Tax=Eupransor demetentiae TaxID=3109584 RepID=A0ABP0EMI2_9LACO|nr:MoxR-like ATPase (MoxR) [Lactobacillaceae bacterium LMG 33000]